MKIDQVSSLFIDNSTSHSHTSTNTISVCMVCMLFSEFFEISLVQKMCVRCCYLINLKGDSFSQDERAAKNLLFTVFQECSEFYRLFLSWCLLCVLVLGRLIRLLPMSVMVQWIGLSLFEALYENSWRWHLHNMCKTMVPFSPIAYNC